ncbi:MAG: hypothetical protein AAGF30_10100, partial [Pseudomonadota bacterium]
CTTLFLYLSKMLGLGVLFTRSFVHDRVVVAGLMEEHWLALDCGREGKGGSKMILAPKMVASRYIVALGVFASVLGLTSGAIAQESASGEAGSGAATLAIELDNLAQVEASCRLTFVARNGLETDADSLVVEAVAFDSNGGVARIALFDFGSLPSNRTRVRQFDLGDMACENVGAVLVNGVQSCDGPAGCASALSVSSRADGVDLMQ